MGEDELAASREMVKHTLLALNKYFETHLYLKVEHCKRVNQRSLQQNGSTNGHAFVPGKAIIMDNQLLHDYVEFLADALPLHAVWRPVEEFRKLGGVPLMLQICAISADWNSAAT